MPNKTITFGVDLLPLRDKDNANGGFNLGSETLQWNIYGNITGSAGSVALTNVTGAGDLTAIEALTGTGFLKRTGDNTWSLTSAVTSITIQTSSPLTGGSNTATTSTGSYTIGFSNQSPNKVLAGPATGTSNGAPTFRSLTTDDIPDLSNIYLTSSNIGTSGGAAAYNHTHSVDISETGSLPFSLSANTTYTLTAAGGTFVFKTPPNASYTLPAASDEALGGIKTGYQAASGTKNYAVLLTENDNQAYVSVPWVEYSSLSAADNGTAVSLVTTGEKYIWNSKANGSHNHSYVSNITWDDTNKVLQQSVDGATATNVVSIAAGNNITISSSSKVVSINAKIQKANFKIPATASGSNTSTLNLNSNAGTGNDTTSIDTGEVIQIIVTSGMEQLQSPITWEKTTENDSSFITLKAKTGGYVEGYILYTK